MKHWTLAVFLVVSALMGLSQAFSACSADGGAHCVLPKNCKMTFIYRISPNMGCSESLVCCDVKSLNLPCGPDGTHQCVPQDLSLTPFQYKSYSECPTNFICSPPKEKIPLVFYEPLR
ncbi:uncharacterized protein LOC26535310 [Drosophila yakuba]|uniref:Seminal fluid protein n=1 Tax=Drosophila yakuba TaxID=7245 RepID=A0A0R1E0A1_DROYA|nr:uncharacterized protein LOC26535310 [Drosophila yakuba]KRK02731.1 uncharacterized protein Dyak_GE28129 [Drosophila yakuba]KRK05480.1 uncharacterized protein Dyak_GE28897 [Drosophila yakuba]